MASEQMSDQLKLEVESTLAACVPAIVERTLGLIEAVQDMTLRAYAEALRGVENINYNVRTNHDAMAMEAMKHISMTVGAALMERMKDGNKDKVAENEQPEIANSSKVPIPESAR